MFYHSYFKCIANWVGIDKNVPLEGIKMNLICVKASTYSFLSFIKTFINPKLKSFAKLQKLNVIS